MVGAMSKSENSQIETPDVRTQILAVATELFAANGFDATPLQAISDRVGVAKPSVLYHFSSKDALRRGVLDQVMSHWNEVLPRLLQAATTGEHRFDSLISESIAFFTEDQDRARLLMRELLDRPAQMRTLFRQFFGPWLTIMADYIRRGQTEGIIRPGVDPESYIIEVLQLMVSTIALGDVFDHLLTPPSHSTSHSTSQTRQLAEVTRVARSALFIDPQSPPSRF